MLDGQGHAAIVDVAEVGDDRILVHDERRDDPGLAFVLSRLVFLILEIVTLLGFGHFAFGVPLRGSLGALFLVCVLAALSFGGVALVTVGSGKDLSGNVWGDLLAILGAATWGAYSARGSARPISCRVDAN